MPPRFSDNGWSRRVSRRSALRTPFGAGVLAFSGRYLYGASDFWNKKPASEWSASDVDQLQTRSPWARKVYAEITRAGGRTGAAAESMDHSGTRGSFGGMTGADRNGISDSGDGRRRGVGSGLDSPPSPSASSLPEVVVRWESAKPVLDATRLTLPADMADHYVLSVTGLPPQILFSRLGGRGNDTGDPAERQQQMINRLMHSASLTAKGRDPDVADQVRQIPAHSNLVFGFAKQHLPLTTADKDVEFVLKMDGLSVKAKFQPKEMLYKGELSL